jgi:hypothetical protein
MRILIGLAQALGPPTVKEFEQLDGEFWCLAEKTARKIRRGELYVAA